MASYAALKSLEQTIGRLLYSSTISIFTPFEDEEIFESAYMELFSLQEYLRPLENCSGERVNAMNAQIREAASKLEDAILSHVSDQFLSQTEEQINIGAGETLSADVGQIKQEFCSFAETAKKIKEENIIEDLLAEEDDNISLRTDFGGKRLKMVEFSDLFSKIKDKLTDSQPKFLSYVSLFGMAGIGKTILAMEIFKDSEILSHFEHRVFVTIGPKYELKDVMLRILAQLTPDIDEIHNKEVGEIGECLFKTLRNRRYLIVLDDVWHASVYHLPPISSR